eukprot:TRINITY_DN29809_c0_g1_i1.p1 TRINITY_DN29809_c0_g1~~TRINITY_DN29809_c0_g1_i1.p1  ORF type:complete len:165 (+),score=38.35 TRINITY_DN29809_c0_g1_i1:59-496(+)
MCIRDRRRGNCTSCKKGFTLIDNVCVRKCTDSELQSSTLNLHQYNLTSSLLCHECTKGSLQSCVDANTHYCTIRPSKVVVGVNGSLPFKICIINTNLNVRVVQNESNASVIHIFFNHPIELHSSEDLLRILQIDLTMFELSLIHI